MIELRHLTPAAEEGWRLLLDLAEDNSDGWLLVGGQMMYLLAVEHGAVLPRPTTDMDVVVDVRQRRDGTQWLAEWLQAHGLAPDGGTPDGVLHRFARDAVSGPGRVVFDVLAPEGLGPAARLFTVPPWRTVPAPGVTQAFARSESVDVAVVGVAGPPRAGRVRRPNLLGALVVKAAAIAEVVARANPERDWQDAALLLSVAVDPFTLAESCSRTDRRRLARLAPLRDRRHPGWATLTDDAFRRGTAALDFLTNL